MRHLRLEWLFATAGIFAIACGDPDLATDLDTEGAPEVTMVTVLTEVPGGAVEAPAFCVDGDFKVNVSLCPVQTDMDGVALPGQIRAVPENENAAPNGWFLRIVFTELLNPAVEELVDSDMDGEVDSGSLANTQPVTITCGGNTIAYDGFYQPSGNDVSTPSGPALFVQPNAFVASGTADCSVTLDAAKILDEDDNPLDGAFAGPYNFGIAPMAVAGASPPDGSTDVAIGSDLTVSFNAPVAVGTVTSGVNVSLDQMGGGNVAFTPMINAMDPSSVDLTGVTLVAGATYTITVDSTGGTAIQDTAGGVLTTAAPVVSTFTVAP